MIRNITLMIPLPLGVDAQAHAHRSTQSLIHYFLVAPMANPNLTVAQPKRINILHQSDR